MRNVSLLLLLGGMLLFTTACSDDNGVSQTEVALKLTSQNVENLKVESGNYTFSNVSTGLENTVAYGSQNPLMPDGLYNVTFIGKGSYSYTEKVIDEIITNEDKTKDTTYIETVKVIENATIQGTKQNVSVQKGLLNLDLAVYVSGDTAEKDFVIAEVFGTGTYNTVAAKAYNGDQYFRIYNNSSEVKYADGLVLLQSYFKTSSKFDYSPDIMNEAMTVDVVAMVPGTGKDYPVKPGESIIICDNALNHKEANANSADLSKADFEWFTNSTSAAAPDVDNPEVPNLNMLYNYTKTIWVLAKQGNTAFAIGRLPANVSPEAYLTAYTYEVSWVNSGNTLKQTRYKFPNTWILDAVNLGPKNGFVWNVTSASLDLGHTYYGVNATVAENYSKAVVRKVAYTTEDGREVLQDTNNSSVDFTPSATPSLLK
ncbi:hypothetical protein GGR06_001704 [Bacteroides reticulotermitis]|nr:DUF4876 domain-containing protein [Bacteroides reticulotermitis]MBB4043918.1 hypothetical protein [Bacteroides reticulotermitis]